MTPIKEVFKDLQFNLLILSVLSWLLHKYVIFVRIYRYIDFLLLTFLYIV